MTTPPFTIDGYVAILRALTALGYVVRDYANADPARRDLILRHDIDMDLGRAVTMAEAEAAIGVRSTYFVLVRTEFYNLFSSSSRRALARLLELGHEVGLHFDAALHPDDPSALDRAAREEALALSLATGGVAPKTMSFHRPAKSLVGSGNELGGMVNAYAPRFISDMGYCSDSRGGWHHGPPLTHPALIEGRALHLLTHPIWWCGAESSPLGRLDGLAAERRETFEAELARHCVVYIPSWQR